MPSSPYCTSLFLVMTVVIRFLSSRVLVIFIFLSFLSKQYTPLTSKPDGSWMEDKELWVTYNFPFLKRIPFGCSMPEATSITSFSLYPSNFKQSILPLFLAFSAPLHPWLSQMKRLPSSSKVIPMGAAQPVSGNTGTSIHLLIFPSLVICIRQAGFDRSAKLGQARMRSPFGAIAIPSGVGQSSGNIINSSLFCMVVKSATVAAFF